MGATIPIFRLEDLPGSVLDAPKNPRQSCLVRIYPASASDALLNLHKPRITIGRDALCDIDLVDDFTSRVHAMIEEIGDHWVISDHGSLNGTFVNDVRIEQHNLEPDDQIRIGNHIFKFLSSDQVEIQYHEAVYEMMTIDALTETHNRRYFEDAFRREVQRAHRHQRPIALLVLDVDFFKHVNDRFGHLVGDEVLRSIGQRLAGRTRGDELLARFGGEEFVTALPEVSLENAVKLAEELRESISGTPIETTRGPVKVTISVGVAHFDGASTVSSGELIERADKKLYEAKHAGRNQVKW